MTETEMEWFGDNIGARWQATEILAVGRAFDLCKPYDSDIVLLAMDKLKQATGDKLVVDADRLAAVCKQISEGGTEADAKTRAERARREALEQQIRTREAREAARNRMREIDEAEILPTALKAAAEIK